MSIGARIQSIDTPPGDADQERFFENNYVIKRDGTRERVYFDKITHRIKKLCSGLDPNYIDPCDVAKQVITGMKVGMKTTDIDTFAAEIAASRINRHPDYGTLAARIATTNLQKQTEPKFSVVIERLFGHKGSIGEEFRDIVAQNAEQLDAAIDHTRDGIFSYFGFCTLAKKYLLKINGQVVERPQHLWMRVAVGIHYNDIAAAIETYELLSQGYYIHGSPTLHNAGTPKGQYSSCFLLPVREDSIDGIYDTLKDCALISKQAGGIGFSAHNIRARGSHISGSGGESDGIVPMLRVYNNTARYINQGGFRPGAFAVYLEPWHADIFEFLELKKNTGAEELRARDLFYGLWIPDLFMKRVESNGDWSLFCPNDAKGLSETWGEEFEQLYTQYEWAGLARKTVKAQKLWTDILRSQTETGTPYMLYKDACNAKSNQQHLGTIQHSNLCTEIVQYSDPYETAVCNLASLSLPRFLNQDCSFNYDKLLEVTIVATKNLNKVIQVTTYPLESARTSNMRHRPIGLGVQGLADVFIRMGVPFDSPTAREVNRRIFETIYYAALTASCSLAKELGPHESYPGSPMSEGKLQMDLWGVPHEKYASGLWDWDSLRASIKQHGVRNSLLVAPMPTATTSQILGNNECFEAYTSNLYARRVLAGEFQIVNERLIRTLVNLGLWNDEMRNKIMLNNGSIQSIDGIPDNIKDIYRTVWEIPQRNILDMAADRAIYIDQSQSMNVFMAQPDFGRLTSMHFYGWKKGLKTGMYYLRTKPAADPIKFTVTTPKQSKLVGEACSMESDEEGCVSCSS